MSKTLTDDPYAQRRCGRDALTSARPAGMSASYTAAGDGSDARHCERAAARAPGKQDRPAVSREYTHFVDPWRGC